MLSSAFILIYSVKGHLQFLSYPYQLEYREGAGLVAAEDFMNGENPYELNLQPQHTYSYGFLYPLLASFVAKNLGNTLLTHRAITYFFLIATCLIVFLVLLKMKTGIIAAFAGMTLLHQSMIYASNTAIARPEGLGIFLMTLAIVIPWQWKFSRLSLYSSILFGLLAFMTKQYYSFSFVAIAVYLFIFIGKKRSLEFFITSLVSLVITFAILDAIFPMYLENTIYVHLRNATYSYSYMKDQVAVFAEVNVYLILIVVLSLMVFIYESLIRRKNETISQVVDEIKRTARFRSFHLFDKPLLECRVDLYFAVVLLLALVVFMINLGGHKGNYMAAYMFQLGSCFMIIVVFQTLQLAKNLAFRTFACILLIFTMNIEFSPQKYEFERYSSCFKQIEELVKRSSNPLNSPEMVSLMLQNDKPVFNSGHTEYFLCVDSTAICKGSVLARYEEFKREVSNKIINKEFDAIFLTEGYYSPFVDITLLYQNYSLQSKLCTPMILQEWKTELWKPR
jgi:hypothetical protein